MFQKITDLQILELISYNILIYSIYFKKFVINVKSFKLLINAFVFKHKINFNLSE